MNTQFKHVEPEEAFCKGPWKDFLGCKAFGVNLRVVDDAQTTWKGCKKDSGIMWP